MELIFVLAALAVTGMWIFAMRRGEKEMRRKLGGDVVEVPLYRRGMIVLQQILIGLAVIIPLVVVIVGVQSGIEGEEIVAELVRSLWMLSVVYGIRASSKLLAGERGIALGQLGMIAREDLREARWDRDIGQRQWGATVTFQRGKREMKHRLYVHRDLKPQVESLLGPRWVDVVNSSVHEHPSSSIQ